MLDEFEIASRAIKLQHKLHAFICCLHRLNNNRSTMAADPPPYPPHQPAIIPPSLTNMHISNIPYHMPLPVHHAIMPLIILVSTNTVIQPTLIPFIHLFPISYSSTYWSSVANATDINSRAFVSPTSSSGSLIIFY
jgi:hypothetical protein